ncbi:GreA/GreB family elongation factor [Litoribacter alkaliphilus]|uniref:GreA/GreB family elongation factor n=1 Tax=Litoribacter ruber TaxID=702568 RepID=A0AAP2G0L6_9BACT|nr:GreA/GreB family elongation factor [Litoribacter alkaliphilus]MBS9522562.1 GreA/GreB family elongation factor [Litoribacter alkaliphilus]
MQNKKQAILAALKSTLESKVSEVKSSLQALDDSGEGETKSSAGDKYETSREMINQERTKFSQVLQDLTSQLQVVNSISLESQKEKVELGALVELDGMTLIISVPFGKLDVEGEQVFAVSIKSPVAQSLLGKTTGDEVLVNKKKMTIKTLC